MLHQNSEFRFPLGCFDKKDLVGQDKVWMSETKKLWIQRKSTPVVLCRRMLAVLQKDQSEYHWDQDGWTNYKGKHWENVSWRGS